MVATQTAVEATPKPKVHRKKKLTYRDYARLTPPDSGDYELHDGNIILMPTPTPKHQRLSMRLSNRLFNHIETNQLGEVFTAPMDTVFTANDVLQPDLLYLSTSRLHLIGDKKIEGAPDLVVEILSPSNTTKEMSYKKFIYEVSEVREYWVINVEKKTITQYESIENELRIRQIYQEQDTLTSVVLEGFSVAIAGLFE
jgi:Uma2 family endonuclease